MNRLQRVTGDFIHGFAPWTAWATFTFRRDVSEALALTTLKTWSQQVANGLHMPMAWAWEPQANGRPHFHVLIALQGEQLYPDETMERLCFRLRRAWHEQGDACGRSEAGVYDPRGGAAWYSAKHRDWDIDIVCPRPPVCRKRKGCVARRKRRQAA